LNGVELRISRFDLHKDNLSNILIIHSFEDQEVYRLPYKLCFGSFEIHGKVGEEWGKLLWDFALHHWPRSRLKILPWLSLIVSFVVLPNEVAHDKHNNGHNNQNYDACDVHCPISLVQRFLEELMDIVDEFGVVEQAKIRFVAKAMARMMLAVRNYVREQTDIDKPFPEWTVQDVIGVVKQTGERP
jgi:hypothetical protein